MYISKDFKDSIASVFYDKEVLVLERTQTVGSEGDIVSEGTQVKFSFKGNVSYSNFKSILELYGNDRQIDVLITTSLDTKIALNDLIQYNGIIYKVTDVIPTDTHFKVVGVKWELN